MMNAKDYWATSKHLDRKYKREADEAVAKVNARKAVEIAEGATLHREMMREKNERLAEAWPCIECGDRIGNVIVSKKSKYSVTSTLGNRYTIAELFGSEVERMVREMEVEHV